MTEIARISDLMRRTFEKEAWHGPSVREAVATVDARQAAARPIPGAHSIWQLVLHIMAWEAEVCRRLDGHAPRTLPPAEDFPSPGDTGEAAWRDTLASLERGHARLREAISRLADARLDDPLGDASGELWTVYTTLHGIIQHDLYHAGQISLLKKAF